MAKKKLPEGFVPFVKGGGKKKPAPAPAPAKK